MAIQQGHRRAIVVADRQVRPVGRAERNAVRMLTRTCVDRNGGVDRRFQVGGIEPQLAVVRGRRRPAVWSESRAVALITIALIAGSLTPALVAVVQPDAARTQRRRQPAAIRREDQVKDDVRQAIDALDQPPLARSNR